MILGLGMDVVDVSRIEKILAGRAEHAARFLARCFTAEERRYCDRARNRAERYAARFAAKEAVSKALGGPPGLRFRDTEVVRKGGAPRLSLEGATAAASARLGVSRIHLTLTHDGGIAAAVVILEGEAR